MKGEIQIRTSNMVEESEDNRIVSNERYYMSPNSIGTLSFEKELIKNKIRYIKNSVSILQPYIVYSFFEKDIQIVNLILDEIEKKSYENGRRKKFVKKKISSKTRQKRIAIGLLLIILLFTLLSLML
jgi:hypothetical protein